MEQDEWLDIVDENDNVIGKKLRSELYGEGSSSFRVINAFLRNANGQLWIPRRTERKRLFPLCLDMSVGGHVGSGESYDDAFIRETKEELDLDIRVLPYRLMGHCSPHDGFSAHMNVYEILTDQVPAYNTEDFTEYFWLSPVELLQRISGGERTKGDLPNLVRRFYQNELKDSA